MRDLRAATARFKRFHGRAPDKLSRTTIPFPKAVVRLGEGVAIEYRSDKLAMGSSRPRTYRHRFDKGVQVYTDPKGRTLYVTGGKFKVTDWMRH